MILLLAALLSFGDVPVVAPVGRTFAVAFGSEETPVVLAGGGANGLAVWLDSGLKAALFGPDGTMGRQVTVAGTSGGVTRAVGVRISADGELLDASPKELIEPELRTAISTVDSRHPAIVWTGSEYLLVRERARFFSQTVIPEIHELRVQRLSAMAYGTTLQVIAPRARAVRH